MIIQNTFKWLDLVDRDTGRHRLVTFSEGSDQNHPKDKEKKEGKFVV